MDNITHKDIPHLKFIIAETKQGIEQKECELSMVDKQLREVQYFNDAMGGVWITTDEYRRLDLLVERARLVRLIEFSEAMNSEYEQQIADLMLKKETQRQQNDALHKEIECGLLYASPTNGMQLQLF